MRFLLKAPALGIDFGSRVLKGVQLTKSAQNKVRLERYFFHDMLDDQNSEAITEQQVSLNLSALVEVHELKRSLAFSAIPDARVLNFTLELPKIPDEELKIAIQNEVENRLSVPLSDYCLDYLNPEEFKHPDGSVSLIVKVYCSERASVDKQLKTLNEASLKPKAIESELFANITALEFNGYLSPDTHSDILVDLGNSHTTVALIKQAEPLFINELSWGGNQLTRAIEENLGVTRQEAERLKDDPTPETLIILEQETYRFISEIQKSVEFFKEHSLSSPISKILIVGGNRCNEILAKLFYQYFEIPAECVDPLRNLEIRQDEELSGERLVKDAPYLSVAIGLALRGLAA